MSDSIFEFVLKGLQSTKGAWPVVAEGSGVPLRTLEKIARGEIANPGVLHVERLARYFRDSAPFAGMSTPARVTNFGTHG